MTHSSRIPVIGISGASADTPSIRAMIAALDRAKAASFLFDGHDKRSATQDIAGIDAIILMGNDFDIDPPCYIGRYPENHPRRCIHPETRSELCTPEGKARAEYEDAIVQLALKAGLPVLGICGGMQRINVVCGGTLHQHVPDLVGHEKLLQTKHGIEPHIPVRPVIIHTGTRLAMIARNIKMSFVQSSHNCPIVIMENSIRHQSIDIVGKGLHVSSLSDAIRRADGTADYLIEAIEADPNGPYRNQFLLGVQWHPEFGASAIGEYIISHLIDAAQRFADNRP